MKKLNFTNDFNKKSLFTLTLIAVVNAPIVNAAETPLFSSAQQTLSISMEESLNQAVANIHVDLQKELTMAMANNQSLDLVLASSQSIKDDKIIVSVSE